MKGEDRTVSFQVKRKDTGIINRSSNLSESKKKHITHFQKICSGRYYLKMTSTD